MLIPLVLLAIFTIAIIFILIITVIAAKKLKKRRAVEKARDHRISVGIFHLYCNSGCPEERVLWCALTSLQSRYPDYRYIVYTGDKDAAPEQILANAKSRLNVTINFPVEFVYLHTRRWVEPASYPRLTRLGINFGSIYVGLEALFKYVPDVYIDTLGYPFTLPVFKYIGGCRVGCYINSVSPDILYSLSNRVYRSSTGNRYIKYLQKFTYSKVYGKLYSWAGRCSDIVMVNSSWTEDRINHLWQCPARTYRVYPPCPVQELSSSALDEENTRSTFKIISLGPFVPHTDHPLQIRTLFQLRQLISESEWERIRLVLIGTCHTPQEATRVKDMEDLCKHLSVEDTVSFRLNLTYNEVKEELQDALIGIHTMYSDPFGIGVVEYMAAGAITVANNSGGIMKDITMEYNGCRNAFLATDELEYAEAIKHILFMRPEARTAIRNQAQASVDRFSETHFNKAFMEAVESLFK